LYFLPDVTITDFANKVPLSAATIALKVRQRSLSDEIKNEKCPVALGNLRSEKSF
jgi:hypothetical protein